MKDKNSSNNDELSVRERMELDKKIRILAADIRKDYPSGWREILKSTDVYKKRHNISDSENDEINVTSERINNNDSNKNKFKKDIKKSDDSKLIKENIEINNEDNLEVNSAGNETKELGTIESKLRKSYHLIDEFYSEINNNGFLSFEKREEMIVKYSPIYKIIFELNKFPDSHKQKIFLEFGNVVNIMLTLFLFNI